MVAGAGTGKTRVITERIRALLESDACRQVRSLRLCRCGLRESSARVLTAAGGLDMRADNERPDRQAGL